MAKLIEFYVPAKFQPSKKRWTPPELRGKIIEFRIAAIQPWMVRVHQSAHEIPIVNSDVRVTVLAGNTRCFEER